MMDGCDDEELVLCSGYTGEPQSPHRKVVHLTGGPHWGFRTCGGRDTNIQLRIARVNPGSKAARGGIREGDLVTAINGMPIDHMTNGEVQRILKKSGPNMTLELKSAKRMITFEGSASTSGESESTGASSSVVTKKSTTETGGSSSEQQKITATSTPNLVDTNGSVNNLQEENNSSEISKEQQQKVNGGGTLGKKSKKSIVPSRSSLKVGKSKKKTVEFQERSVDEDTRKEEQQVEEQEQQQREVAHEESNGDVLTTAERHCTCGGGGGYTNNANSAANKMMEAAVAFDKRSSLLGEIIAELDGFLDTTYFSYTHHQAASAPLNSRNLSSTGVWAPGSTPNNSSSLPSLKQDGGDQVDSSRVPLPALEEPPPAVWTPANAPSPASQRKFRPVNFNVPSSPTSSSPRTISLERSFSAGHVGDHKLQIIGAASTGGAPADQHQQQQQLQQQRINRIEGGTRSSHQDSKTQSDHSLHQSHIGPSVNLPRYQSPTVTLLHAAREGHLPKGAHYLDHKNSVVGVQRSSSASGGFNSLLSQQHPAAGPSSSSQQQPSPSSASLNPNDTLYELKKEDYQTTPTGSSRRAEFTPKKYEGVGPTTPDGVPISLKTGISSNGHEWYRRMYESLHVDNKAQRKGVPQRSSYGGGQTSGSWSEPEGYESDTYAYKYATLDRRKVRDRYLTDSEYLSPGVSSPTSIPGSIRFTPGRIEDYTPGNSSVVAKEIRRHKPTLQWALGSKDFGYESDTNLVIKKRQESQDLPPPPPISPAEQHQLYVEIQKGGEVPFRGLRKPAPEKHKEMSPMPTFEEVKRSLTSPRAGSPSSFRSGSPSMLKSTTTVALLQERLQAKLRRANSDINPSSRATGRNRSGGTATTRYVHTVRSMSQSRSAGPTSSFIPVRSRNTSMEKLRVSSPELTSPREVKKAMETSHKLSIKFEVFESVPAAGASAGGGGGTRKSRQSEHGSDKKGGVKKSSSKSGKGKSKSVKIAETPGAVPSSNNGAGTSTPAKPPRKVNGKSERTPSSTPPEIAINGTKVKTMRATPVATRHAGCLSPHTSRPTSPGPSTSAASATATAAGTATSTTSVIPVPPKIPPAPVKVQAVTVKATTKAERKKASVVATANSSGVAGKDSNKSHAVIGTTMESQENKTNRISRSLGATTKVSSADSAETAIKFKTTGSSTSKSEHESRRASKRARDEIESSVRRRTEFNVSSQAPLALSLPAAASSYLTLPSSSSSRREREYLTDVWTLDEERRYRSRSTTPNFRSLPALTPYLKETRRVTGSSFVTKTNHAAMLREKAALAKRLGLDEASSSKAKAKRIKDRSSSAGAKQQTSAMTTSSSAAATSKDGKPRQIPVVRSASCLGLRRSWDYTYAKYIMELQHSRKKSPRFLQLHRLYSSLERLGQLERSASMYDIPILSLERQLDFDAWWKVRNRTRVDEEIASICSELTEAQRNREFFFRPRRVEEFRWKGDSALRCKQWSINELRAFVMGYYDGRQQSKSASDLHKTAWRGSSVKETALTMEVNALSKAGYTLAENSQLYGGPWLRRAFSMCSTLSEDQRENIKRRLGSLIRPEKLGEKREREGRPTERRVVTTRMGLTTSSDRPAPSSSGGVSGGKVVGTDGCLTEAAKKQLSRSLSQEFRERKITEKKTKTSESESAKSDDSVRTVIHVPISTQLLLKKIEKDKEKSKVPAYSVYCRQGVPSKVTFFESYYKKEEPDDGGRQFSTLPTSGKSKSATRVVSGSSTVGSPRRPPLQQQQQQQQQQQPADLHYHHRLHHERMGSVSPSRSPSGLSRRSRSVSPTASTKASLSYMSHVNVISRLASMLLKKDEALKSIVTREILERQRLERLRLLNAGEVDRLKYYYETRMTDDMDDDEYRRLLPEINLLRCLFCSDPNLAQMTEWRSEHCDRRCASADIFKEKLITKKDQLEQQQQQQQLDRKPDGRESSPVNCSSPDLYLNSRSRKPIYQPSSTPNVCQPTLTAHCFLESPNKSLEYLNQQHQPAQQYVQQPAASSSCYSSDFSGNFWDYHSTDSIGTASPSPPYHSVSIPPAPARANDSRVSQTSSMSNPNWNVDPALHQPKFRYVPPQPRTNVHAMPPPIPPPPPLSSTSSLPTRSRSSAMYHHQQQLQQQQGKNAENRPVYNPYLYRSVRYWTPRTRTREHDGPIPPNRYPSGANRTESPLPPPVPPTYSTKNNNVLRRALSFRQADSSDEFDGGDENYGRKESVVVNVVGKSGESKGDDDHDGHEAAGLANDKNSLANLQPNKSPAPPPLPPAAAPSTTTTTSTSSIPSPVKYAESEVNIHYKAPVRLVEKDYIAEEELRKRQQQSMKRFYEEQRQRKFLQEIQDMENRRHTDNFTPSQKSPIPLNRYEDVIDEPQRPKWREKTPEHRVVARALYNFVPQNSRELSFRKGDILYIRRKLDANWYEGEHNAAIGIFPASYVEIIPPYEWDRATTPRVPNEGQARVRFSFTAASPIEMSIVKGETVILTRRVDVNWYEGRIGSRRGIFPVSYVQVLKEPGADLTTVTTSNRSAATSPKPVGSPAAHSLAARQNFRHNYKPNDYTISSDYSSLHESRASPAPHNNNIPNNRGDIYGAGRLNASNTKPAATAASHHQQGRSSYSQNLTIDTRIDPLPYKAIYNYRPAHEDELELKENDIVHVLEKCDDGWYVGTSTRTGLFGTFPGNYVERVF